MWKIFYWTGNKVVAGIFDWGDKVANQKPKFNTKEISKIFIIFIEKKTRLSSTVEWVRAAKAGILGSIPGHVISKTCKTVLAFCPAGMYEWTQGNGLRAMLPLSRH